MAMSAGQWLLWLLLAILLDTNTGKERHHRNMQVPTHIFKLESVDTQ